ncbi:MAG: hypothetical protein KDH15_04860 [Rhodocyclaceae bacterium]|nr:hypothetical protein [Rhodocyclaceae bacterium]
MSFEFLPRSALQSLLDADRVLGGVGFGPAGGTLPALLEVAAPALQADGPALWVLRADDRPAEGRSGRIRHRSGTGVVFGRLGIGEAEFGVDAPMRLVEATRQAYQEIFDCIDELGCRHLLRVWNYLPRINQIEHGEERYRRFNAGRQLAFESRGRALEGAVPAACAVGTGGERFDIAFLATRDDFVPIENPRQTSAYHYPAEYGERSPTFCRAALLPQRGGDLLMISGTAAIVGHRSLHAGDVLAQTREAMANIEAVLGRADEHGSGGRHRLGELMYTVYLRRRDDLAAVGRLLATEYQLRRRPMFVEADICRSELLVEIEACGEGRR